MAINRNKVEQAFELLSQANALFQSAGIEVNAVDGEDPVYNIHCMIEALVNDIEEELDSVNYFD